MSRLCILFLSIVTWSTLNRGEDSAADVVIIPEQTPIGYVLVSRQNDSDAHEFAWSSPTNSTPNSHDRFALDPRTGALTLAKPLLGLGGHEFRLSIDVSTARRVVRVVELRIVVTKAISCPLTTINATLSAEAEVGTIVTFFRCKQPNDLPLVYYGDTNDYFALDRTENGSFLYVNRSLERFDDDFIALRIVVALELENAIRINETIRVGVSIQPRELLCKNGTVSTSTVAPRPLRIDLTEYCGVHVSYGLRDVSSAAPNATLSGTIVSIANRLKAGTYRIFYEARRGNRTTTGSIRIFAIAPAIFPKNVSISLPETENRGKSLMVFNVRGFPLEEEIRFALNANDDDEGSLPFRLTSTNETEATLSLATSLDYEKPDQKKAFTFRVVARSNGGATANATATVRLINANDNPPVLTIKEITIPDRVHLNESIAQIGWVDADSSKSTVTMEMEFTRVADNKARLIEPNPFRLNSTSGALSLVRRLDNDDAICCYSVYVRLTDYGFPDMAPLSKSQAITERIVARLNSSRCTAGCEYTGTVSPTESEPSNGFRKEYIYAIIAGSIGCFLLVLFVVATAIFWRRATMKQQRLDQILLNEILPSVERKENASRRSTVSKQPRLPTVYEDSDETDEEGDATTTTTTTTRRAPSSGNVETKKFDSFWTIPRRNLRLGYTIRKGSYTDVYYGKVMGLRGRDKTDAAIKILKANTSDEDKRLFVEELDVLKDTLRHPNVISFWGACVSDGDRQPMMIVYEFAPHGNLRDFLRKARCQEMDGTPPSLSPVNTTTKTATITLLPSELLTFALQIAKGMGHLTAMKRVHGNLAARNVLVGSKFVMKLCDFGLVNQRMSGRSVGEEFEKWMAVELFNENNPRTIQSDIWSYGVVLWEILTLGDSPYSEIHLEDLYTKLKGGYRMKKPDNCSGKLYEIMKNCWAVQPTERPPFRELAKRIEQLLASDATYLILETSTDEQEDTFANPLYEPDEGEKTREIDTIVKQLDEKISELVSII